MQPRQPSDYLHWTRLTPAYGTGALWGRWYSLELVGFDRQMTRQKRQISAQFPSIQQPIARANDPK